MDYKEAINYIHGSLKFGIKLGLENMTVLLELLGNPHKRLKFIHIAGTNGKGSTAAFITSILTHAGYRVGTFTSPYIQRFNERIKIDGEDIEESDLARLTGKVKAKVDLMVERGSNHPTEFEIVTAVALLHYFEKSCDIVVLEVGLGGRFDSTNIIDTPLAAVITTINYDHMNILGNTLPKIAYEKAGIIKENTDVIAYPQTEEVLHVLQEACENTGSRLNVADFGTIVLKDFSIDGQEFDYKGYKNLRIKLIGEYQLKNAALAVDAAELLNSKGLKISQDAVRTGLFETTWPGRFEVVSKRPLILIDGAHNEEGAKVLADSLRKYFPHKKKLFIMGVLKDKDYKSLIEAVAPIASGFITVRPHNDRALDSRELAAVLKNYCANVVEGDTIKEAVKAAVDRWTEDIVICAFGSLYYIGEVRELLSDKNYLEK